LRHPAPPPSPHGGYPQTPLASLFLQNALYFPFPAPIFGSPGTPPLRGYPRTPLGGCRPDPPPPGTAAKAILAGVGGGRVPDHPPQGGGVLDHPPTPLSQTFVDPGFFDLTVKVKFFFGAPNTTSILSGIGSQKGPQSPILSHSVNCKCYFSPFVFFQHFQVLIFEINPKIHTNEKIQSSRQIDFCFIYL